MTRGSDVREGLAAGAIASLLWAIPVALRVGTTVSTGLAFVALAGSAALVLGPATALIGAVPLHRGTPARALLVGASSCAAPLAVFGAVLHDKTHHRPLGGVTFGIIGLFVALGAVIVARRLPAVVGERVRGGLSVALDVLAALSLLAALALGAASASPVRVGLTDAVLGVLAVAVVLRFRTRLPRGFTGRGILAWVGIVVVGLAVLRSQPNLSSTLAAEAPVVFGLGAWAGG